MIHSNHTCPRCCQPISMEKMLENVVVCSCGWNGPKSHFQTEKKKQPIKKFIFTFFVLLIGYMIYDARTWGQLYSEKLWYHTLSTLKMTTAKDEARMAFVCKKLGKHSCAAQAYTTALNKSPKSYNLAGALGIELSIIGQYDQAILTFQNYFSHSDGNHEHKRHYARALSNEDYIEDASEWYYKSLKDKPKSFATARELIHHLAKNELYGEALGVIGHYNNLFPKTRKKWKQLIDEVTQKYTDYNSQYSITEMKIMGFNKYLYAPGSLVEGGEVILFMVDPESEFLTLDLNALRAHNLNFKTLGSKKVMANNGRSIESLKILLPQLTVGPFQLKNVKALACENCAPLLGKDIMKRLNFKNLENNKGVQYITLRQ